MDINILKEINFFERGKHLVYYSNDIEIVYKNESFYLHNDDIDIKLNIHNIPELVQFIYLTFGHKYDIERKVISQEMAKEHLITIICTHFNLTKEEFIGDKINLKKQNKKHRSLNQSFARHIYCKIMKDNCMGSLKDIGKGLANRDHTTVINSINKINNAIQIKDEMAEVYYRINSAFDAYLNKVNIAYSNNSVSQEFTELKVRYNNLTNYIDNKIAVTSSIKTADKDRTLVNNAAIYVYKDIKKQLDERALVY